MVCIEYNGNHIDFPVAQETFSAIMSMVMSENGMKVLEIVKKAILKATKECLLKTVVEFDYEEEKTVNVIVPILRNMGYTVNYLDEDFDDFAEDCSKIRISVYWGNVSVYIKPIPSIHFNERKENGI